MRRSFRRPSFVAHPINAQNRLRCDATTKFRNRLDDLPDGSIRACPVGDFEIAAETLVNPRTGGDREDRTTELSGKFCSVSRATAQARLDDDDGANQRREQGVAGEEQMASCLPMGRYDGQVSALILHDFVKHRAMLGWKRGKPTRRRDDHRGRPSAKCRKMGLGIDASSTARPDRNAMSSQLAHEFFGELQCFLGGVACSHHSDRRASRQLADQVQMFWGLGQIPSEVGNGCSNEALGCDDGHHILSTFPVLS